MICSANPGEGKSSLSMNLAASLAMRDYKVALMDIDLRNLLSAGRSKCRSSPD